MQFIWDNLACVRFRCSILHIWLNQTWCGSQTSGGFCSVRYFPPCGSGHSFTHRWSLSLMKGCLSVLKRMRDWESLWMSMSGTSGWNGLFSLATAESHIPAIPVRFRNSHFCPVETFITELFDWSYILYTLSSHNVLTTCLNTSHV